jgi:hypothetical protein
MGDMRASSRGMYSPFKYAIVIDTSGRLSVTEKGWQVKQKQDFQE